MDIIGGLLVGAGLVLVIIHPELQWHWMLGAGIVILVVPRLLDSLTGLVKSIRAPKV